MNKAEKEVLDRIIKKLITIRKQQKGMKGYWLTVAINAIEQYIEW